MALQTPACHLSAVWLLNSSRVRLSTCKWCQPHGVSDESQVCKMLSTVPCTRKSTQGATLNFPESSSDGFPHHPERKQHKGAALKSAKAAGGEEGAGMVAPRPPTGRPGHRAWTRHPLRSLLSPTLHPLKPPSVPTVFLTLIFRLEF